MKFIIYYIFIVFLLVSCATPGAPQGGPQDKNPPIVKLYEPDNLTINFSKKDVSIFFDEWIQIANLKQQLIISPPINPDPVITAKKNELKIHFKEALDSNTTYSIFFGDAVKDNNEGNIANNLSYVFSTGDYIDSLSISGKVVTLDGSALPANTFVELYKFAEDSVITKERPRYIYKISTDGTFKLNYLPNDTFKLFVLNDLNTNYIYDLPTEWVGKYDSMIVLEQPIENIELPIVLPESENYKVFSFNNTLVNRIVTIELNKELNPQKDTILLKILSSGNVYPLEQHYTSNIFQYFILSDSLSVNCELSINGTVIDTMKLRRPQESSEKQIFLPKVQMNEKDSILSAFNNANFEFYSNVPVEKVDKEKIFIVSEEDTVGIDSISVQDDIWGFTIHYPIKETFKGRLVFGDSSVLFRTGKYADTIDYPIRHAPSNEYGQLTFDIQLPSVDTSYLLRVFNKSGLMIYETSVKGDSTYSYVLNNIKTGDFFVEAIKDINESATWNGASFWSSRPPEKVFKSESYTVKPNWEDVYEIKINFQKQQLPTKSVNWLELMKTQSVVSQPQVPKNVDEPSNVNKGIIPPTEAGRPNFQRR